MAGAEECLDVPRGNTDLFTDVQVSLVRGRQRSSSRRVRPVASSWFCNLRVFAMPGSLIPRETRQVSGRVQAASSRQAKPTPATV